MKIEYISLQNFRCFGPTPHKISFDPSTTIFIGTNGTGKTAVMHALLRLFGITDEQRRIRRHDFHVPATEKIPVKERTLAVEVVFGFPELAEGAEADTTAIPEFFHQMAADEDGHLKCRLRFEAKWVDDGSLDGAIEHKFFAVRTLSPEYDAETECSAITAADRARVQMIYVPAVRDGATHLSAFLKSRLWRAITWSEGMRTALTESGKVLNDTFVAEAGVALISKAVTTRWKEISSAGTTAQPHFRPINLDLNEFIRKVEVVFRPDASLRDREINDLSDGQRSLFHIAMTVATLDIESKIANGEIAEEFKTDDIAIPALTLMAVEEPENNLAPFYLSQIMRQIESATAGNRAQGLISSHSASILARIDPEKVRYFRLNADQVSAVRSIRLPAAGDVAAKFVREAVHIYPELYFARFVVLGEGSTEEIVLPRIAEAMGLSIDRSFVAVVPLGGRHVHHLWRLLTDLEIPHVTLLDLDTGRAGGGWGRIKSACTQLLENAALPDSLFKDGVLPEGNDATLASFDGRETNEGLEEWVQHLRNFGVYFVGPLDLDWAMLTSFPEAYKTVEDGGHGPTMVDGRSAVLGDAGDDSSYSATDDEFFRWYRYLFLGRSKPNTHLRVLGSLNDADIRANAPEVLRTLLGHVNGKIFPPPQETPQEGADYDL